MSDAVSIRPPKTQALLMAIFSVVVCLLLVISTRITAPEIARQEMLDTQVLLDQVLPKSLYDNNPLATEYRLDGDPDQIRFYRARMGNSVSAVALFATTQGYAGAIDLIVGLDRDGSVTGVRVLRHAETPGLGDNIELAKSNWILGFNGHSLQDLTPTQWQVKKDGGEFDAFTGATITPRAVVLGVYQSLNWFMEHRAAVLEEEE